MPPYPKIKLIPDIVDKDEIIVKEEDLIVPTLEIDLKQGSFQIVDVNGNMLVEIRDGGNLKNKALCLNTYNNEPKIVTDSEGLTSLIFIKKKER